MVKSLVPKWLQIVSTVFVATVALFAIGTSVVNLASGPHRLKESEDRIQVLENRVKNVEDAWISFGVKLDQLVTLGERTVNRMETLNEKVSEIQRVIAVQDTRIRNLEDK